MANTLFRKHAVVTCMTGFLETLYRLEAREEYRTPGTLAVDEADAITPQRLVVDDVGDNQTLEPSNITKLPRGLTNMAKAPTLRMRRARARLRLS